VKQFVLIMAIFSVCTGSLIGQGKTPADYWQSLSQEEKLTFVNGAYAMTSRLQTLHDFEVKKQYTGDPSFIEPYYIERYYQIIDEFLSTEVGGNLSLITGSLDALYANSDNVRIPLTEAIRIVSLAQDGERKKGNFLLLKAQKKYKP
jgi:hypothetical protein